MDRFRRAGLSRSVGRDHFHLEVCDAVDAAEALPPSPDPLAAPEFSGATLLAEKL